jgi:hypothetical protein
MSKLENSSAHNGHSPSLVDQVGETLLGEIGMGPKAFYKESDQFLRDPNYLAHHPELYVMPGTAISQPLQLGWKAIDDTGHLVFNTAKDEFGAGIDFVKAGIIDPAKGIIDGAKGFGNLVTGHPGAFVKDEFNGIKELTFDPLWDGAKGVLSAVKPVADVLSHPLHAGIDTVETVARVAGDGIDVPINVVKGAFDFGIKAPADLITGHPGKALSDIASGMKHETVDIAKDAYKGVSHALNGVAHAVFDLF